MRMLDPQGDKKKSHEGMVGREDAPLLTGANDNSEARTGGNNRK